MTPVLQIVLVVFSVAFLAYVLRLVSHGRLQLKYALLWLFCGLVALIISLFPKVASYLAHSLGFGLTSNFVFFVTVALLMGICLALTVIVSWQSRDIRSLIQQLALLRKELEEREDDKLNS